MTGQNDRQDERPVKSVIRLDIVRWPAVIFSPVLPRPVSKALSWLYLKIVTTFLPHDPLLASLWVLWTPVWKNLVRNLHNCIL